jgi:proteasome lid subunit RPN8/RPN11
MFNNIVGSVVIALAIALHSAAPELNDNVIARLAHTLLRQVGGLEEIELAAFIVKTPRGAFDLQRWPNRGHMTAHWTGPMPEGVVGVIHSHPVNVPKPSLQDRGEAMRLRLPFYVVSRGALCVAGAFGGVQCAERVPWLRRDGMIGVIALNWQFIVTGGS